MTMPAPEYRDVAALDSARPHDLGNALRLDWLSLEPGAVIAGFALIPLATGLG